LFYRLNGAQFLQQGLVVDTVKAFLDVGVQNVFGLQADGVEDCLYRIVCRPSRAKAIGVGFKLGFPFRL
jgi:hypothetical protein